MHIFLSNGVRHHHKQASLNLSVSLPALLSTLDALRQRHEERIQKYLAGQLEADAVLALISEVLRLVPLETDSTHYNSVIINMALCNIPPLRNQAFPFLSRERWEFDTHQF